MLELDHVIYVVEDLDDAVGKIESTYGLVSLPGGIHPFGTANRLVPLRESQYLEFLTVHDATACEQDETGRRVLSLIQGGGGLAWWALRTDRIDEIAARTRLEAVPGSIQDTQGNTLGSWRYVFPADDRRGALPFFVEYDQDLADRAAVWDERFERAAHPSGATAFSWVEVAVEESTLRNWVNDSSLPVRIASVPEGIRSVGLSSPMGQIAIQGR